MVFTIILVIFLVASVGILGFLIWKKLPQVRIVDPDSAPEARSSRLKHDIMRQRVERASGKHMKAIQSNVLGPVGKGAQNFIRRIAGKLTAVERRYQEKQKQESGVTLDKDTIKRLLDEGRKLSQEERWDSAEKKFIEIISSEPKNVEAYEELGRLYQAKKDFDLAKETFTFLTKLSPKDASVIASLGEVESRLGNYVKALVKFKRAVKLSPKNPKYLDFLITTAIEVADKALAMTTLDRLRQVNPDNKKIAQFEEKINAIEVGKDSDKK